MSVALPKLSPTTIFKVQLRNENLVLSLAFLLLLPIHLKFVEIAASDRSCNFSKHNLMSLQRRCQERCKNRISSS